MIVEKLQLDKIFMNIMDFSFTLLMSISVYVNYFIIFYCFRKFSGSNSFVSTIDAHNFLQEDESSKKTMYFIFLYARKSKNSPL